MANHIIAYGVEIHFCDREVLTVPTTMTTGYMVSSVNGDPNDLVTYGTFNKDLYLRWRGELDRAGRPYKPFEPE
jgi:hypothetical protein